MEEKKISVASRLGTHFCVVKEVGRRITSLLASCCWLLLSACFFRLSGLIKAYRHKRIDINRSKSERNDYSEESRKSQGGDEREEVAEQLLGGREIAAEHEKDWDGCLLRDNDCCRKYVRFSVGKSIGFAAAAPEVIELFSYECQSESESESEFKDGGRLKNRDIDEAFSSNKERESKFGFTSRFLRAEDFGGSMEALNWNTGKGGYLHTEVSSSVGSNCDVFSERETSQSSFDEDDFLSEKDFICVKPRPIALHLSSLDLEEEIKAPHEKLNFGNALLREKDEAYYVLGTASPDIFPMHEGKEEPPGMDEASSMGSTFLEASSDGENESSEPEEDEASISSTIPEVSSDQEETRIGMDDLETSQNCYFESHPGEFTRDRDVGGRSLTAEEESDEEIPNQNRDTLQTETHAGNATHNPDRPLQYQDNQERNLEILHSETDDPVQHEVLQNQNPVSLLQMKDTQNQPSETLLEATSDEQTPNTTTNLLRYEGAGDQNPDLLTKTEDANHHQNGDFPSQTDDIHYQNFPSETSDAHCQNHDPPSETDFQNQERRVESKEEEEEKVQRGGRKEEEEEYEDEGLEAMWEHQELVEQLRAELRRARATGLPTIFEESELPKVVMDDLKLPQQQWGKRMMGAADSRGGAVEHDRMEEMSKFYNSYSERMRRFDVLNCQKTFSKAFLKLENPLQSISSRKSAIPSLTSALSQSFKRHRSHKTVPQPSAEFVKELQVDLETVYVGQTCLSWEILHWQFIRIREVSESDQHEWCNFDRVAGEFQRFLVLLTRFIEEEEFKGPRLDNYVQNRSVQRAFLHVPLVREEKTGEMEEEEEGTSVDNLLEIMEDCLRAFWEFIKRDRDEIGSIMKGLMGVQTQLQDPADSELYADIQASLRKKEKRLKDLQRSGNCLVKRFKKHQGGWMDESLFFSLVDLKLVARVLRMSRVTSDQLDWCQKKLHKISLKGRKLVRDPSFLLFPC